MRILIVATYFPPLNSIASLRPYSWAKAWSLAGHDVTVLTTTKIRSPIDLALPLDGFKIVSVALPRFFYRLKQSNTSTTPSSTAGKFKSKLLSCLQFLKEKKGILNTCRMPDFSDLWILPALKALRYEPSWDLVISTAGPYATHIVAANIKKRGQARLWAADYRDAWSDSRIYPGLFPFNYFERWLEKRLVQQADMISTISPPFAKTYASLFPGKKVVTIENGYDPNDLSNLNPAPIFPADDTFRLVYTGSLYPGKQDPSPLFEAINIIRHDKDKSLLFNRLEVIFAGPHQPHLETLIALYQLEGVVTLKGFISREDALRMQRDAHALLFLAWNDPAAEGIMTGKLFEYLSSNTPILSINNHGIESSQQLIIDAKAGVAYTRVSDIVNWLTSRLNRLEKSCVNVPSPILKRYHRDLLAHKLLDSLHS